MKVVETATIMVPGREIGQENAVEEIDRGHGVGEADDEKIEATVVNDVGVEVWRKRIRVSAGLIQMEIETKYQAIIQRNSLRIINRATRKVMIEPESTSAEMEGIVMILNIIIILQITTIKERGIAGLWTSVTEEEVIMVEGAEVVIAAAGVIIMEMLEGMVRLIIMVKGDTVDLVRDRVKETLFRTIMEGAVTIITTTTSTKKQRIKKRRGVVEKGEEIVTTLGTKMAERATEMPIITTATITSDSDLNSRIYKSNANS